MAPAPAHNRRRPIRRLPTTSTCCPHSLTTDAFRSRIVRGGPGNLLPRIFRGAASSSPHHSRPRIIGGVARPTTPQPSTLSEPRSQIRGRGCADSGATEAPFTHKRGRHLRIIGGQTEHNRGRIYIEQNSVTGQNTFLLTSANSEKQVSSFISFKNPPFDLRPTPPPSSLTSPSTTHIRGRKASECKKGRGGRIREAAPSVSSNPCGLSPARPWLSSCTLR